MIQTPIRLRSPARVLRDGDATIRVGGLGSAFVPECEVRRWDDQWVRLRLLHDEPGIVSVDQAAVVWTTASLEARWYRLPDQRFECATLFPGAVPPVVRFAYETSADVETTHQPAYRHRGADYSWERTPWGGERRRPVDVENSFAAYVPWSGDYRRCGGWNYQSGKVAHLYRPWIVDAVGTRAWCPMTLDRGILTIEIPAAFRATALGPCLLDPTFGYSGAAASDDNVGKAHIWIRAASNPATDGSLTSITIMGRIRGDDPTHEPALYSNSGTAPSALLAAVNSGGALYGATDAEVTTNIAYGSLVSGTQYWLGFRSDNSVGGGTPPDAWFKVDASGGTTNFQYNTDLAVGDPWETPTAIIEGTLDDAKVYLYGTFTAAGVTPYEMVTTFKHRGSTRPGPYRPGNAR